MDATAYFIYCKDFLQQESLQYIMYTFRANPLMLVVTPFEHGVPSSFHNIAPFFASVFVLIEPLFQFTQEALY